MKLKKEYSRTACNFARMNHLPIRISSAFSHLNKCIIRFFYRDDTSMNPIWRGTVCVTADVFRRDVIFSIFFLYEKNENAKKALEQNGCFLTFVLCVKRINEKEKILHTLSTIQFKEKKVMMRQYTRSKSIYTPSASVRIWHF